MEREEIDPRKPCGETNFEQLGFTKYFILD